MGGRGKAECECMCESAGLFSVNISSPSALLSNPSPVAVCEGREGAGESALSPPSLLSLPSLSLLSVSSLSLSPSPPLLSSLFVCVPVCGCWGGGRARRVGELGARGQGRGGRRRGEEGRGDAGTY